MRMPNSRLVSGLIFTIAGVLAARPAVAQTYAGPMIRPSAVVPLAESRSSGSTVPDESALDAVAPLTREEYKAGLLRWARIGFICGAVAGAIFVIPIRTHPPSVGPYFKGFVILIFGIGGGVTGMQLFQISHGPLLRQ